MAKRQEAVFNFGASLYTSPIFTEVSTGRRYVTKPLLLFIKENEIGNSDYGWRDCVIIEKE